MDWSGSDEVAGMTRAGSHLVEVGVRLDLRAYVTRALRAAIVAGELAPGTVYSAPGLAKLLNVSATPVREAMIDLAREGLVTAVRNKGFRISEVSEDDLDQITALRMLVEPAAVREAVHRIPAAEVERLRDLARTMLDSAAADDLPTYLDLDREFHLGLIHHCGNRRLVILVAELRSQTRLYGMPVLAERHDLATTAAEHLELIDLVEAGDADGAESLMRRHLGHVRGMWALNAE